MVTSLFIHERIKTSEAKAKAIRRTAEKEITRAGVDTVHNRRMAGRIIKDKSALAKLFTDIGPRFKERPGGYTRILKLGPRNGDATEMVLLELVERTSDTEQKGEEKKKRRARRQERKAQEQQAQDEQPEPESEGAQEEDSGDSAERSARDESKE
jgi:large subunit ribosomal protein L17